MPMGDASPQRKQVYDAMLRWDISSNEECNLNCEYCFKNVSRQELREEQPLNKSVRPSRSGLFSILSSLKHRILWFETRANGMPRINIKAFLRTLEETNRIFKISFTQGEPFLVPNMVDASVAITVKHFIAFNTNLSSGKIREFAIRVDPSRVVQIIASLHIEELQRRGLLSAYIDNYLLCKERGFPISAVEVAYPSLMPKVEQYKAFFNKCGIAVKFAPYIGRYDERTYPDCYTREELEIFGLSKPQRVDIHYQKGQLCNSGYNVGVIDRIGNVTGCPYLRMKIGQAYKRINFKKELIRCPADFCACPLKSYDPYLFEKAVSETGDG